MIDAGFQRRFVYLAEMTCVTIEAKQHIWFYLIYVKISDSFSP